MNIVYGRTGVAAQIWAALACFIGGCALVGWHLHLPELIQLRRDWAPMQYFTALCGLSIGAASLFIIRRRYRVAAGFAALVGVITSITLLEYIFGFTLVIFGRNFDELLFPARIVVETSHPGRMAPNTALCYLLLAIAASSPLWRRTHLLTRFASMMMLGIFSMSLATVALLGYLFQLEHAYGWAAWTDMAAHTSVSLALLGFSVFLVGWHHLYGDELPSWLAIPVTTYAAVCALGHSIAVGSVTGNGSLAVSFLMFGAIGVTALSAATRYAMQSRRLMKELLARNKELEKQVDTLRGIDVPPVSDAAQSAAAELTEVANRLEALAAGRSAQR